jgi:uncharacterized protein
MTEQTGQETLEAFFAAFKDQDTATMEALLAPDFVIREADGLPYAGTYQGFTGWMELLGRIGSTWEGLTPTVRHLLGDGRNFAVLMDLTLTSKVTGRALDTSIFELWTVEAGKITQVRPFYWDTKAVAALAG